MLIKQFFFDKYISAWNPPEATHRNNQIYRYSHDDPCLLNTIDILATNPLNDFEELVNRVQRHTKCRESTCLRKKGRKLECRYKAPWKEQHTSILFCDEMRTKKHEPARNDDRLNIHNPEMISIWRANIDCQPVISCELVLKYIAKYASKAERTSESCTAMLTRISTTQKRDDPVVVAYRRFMTEIVAERDIGAQETCHMLQKLPLVVCNKPFTTLNVGRKVLHVILYPRYVNHIYKFDYALDCNQICSK